ncbi:TonB-dependent receptor [Algibacillus agarilyticus]|uniref:TonB-dependent receptor n=1 Tax=Algibacillus agarilyticus TaxID=2234133 RepID=UPI000DD0ECF3|nr:TonB-dependent receptor [Algibacillus agarilyticus]
MKTRYNKTLLSLAVTAGLGLSQVAVANDTSSAIKGQISTPAGTPAAGTIIKIVHVPSQSTKTTTVNEAGTFVAKGLRVGGPYKITVDSDKYKDQQIKGVFLSLGKTYPLNVQLGTEAAMEEVVSIGQMLDNVAGGTGPSTTFTLDNLENAPAISRDLKDIVRADPRVYIDEGEGDDAIQCGGGNPKFNSLTVDGVRMNDNFGLNANGYPTVRAPFSYDAIDQVTIELAPFDVKYGGFTSCNFNAVTKSGGNEVHGSVFIDYTNDSMTGDKLNGEAVDTGDFTEKRYGFNVGLPLIEDELFLFASYEALKGAELFSYPGLGNDPEKDISQTDISRIRQIAKDVYDYDIGGTPGSMPVDDEKMLIKLDWNINNDHRASVVYNYNDGFRLNQSDDWAVTLDSHFFERGAEFTSLVGSLYSDWSDKLSTEIRIGKSELDMRQQSLDAASSFGEVQIRHNGNTLFLGPDDSRQTNDLDWDSLTFKFAANYYLENHTLTAGYELEKLNVFNLFMQHTQGEFRFDSIDDFETGDAARIYYNNSAGTSNPLDVAAEFSFAQHTFYLQDEFTLPEHHLSLTFGLRYDQYTSDDEPRHNQKFATRYGFSNAKSMDGLDLLQPRLGFKWNANEQLEVRGGIGLYSGGNPNVWVANSYQNDGITQIALQERGVNLFNTPMVNNGKPIFEVPQSMYDEIANTPVGSGDGSVNAINPNFEVPSEWKYALGATYSTADDYIIALDFLHSQKQDSAIIKDASLKITDQTAPDGRPIYTQSVEGRYSEYVLSNVEGDDGESTVISAALSKNYDNGFDFTVAYSYTQAEDVSPMTSSVAGSNYGNLAVTNPGNPGIATSDYEIPHRFTLQLGYSAEFISGYKTRFNVFGQASEGQPYSYTFERSDGMFGDNNWNGSRQLIYVPLENDPTVTYADSFDQTAFNQFIESEGLTRGQILDRNEINADWYTKFDFKVSQEIPGFQDDHRGQVFFVIKNVGNLLNDEWGVIEEGDFVGNRLISANINDQGQYEYTQFNASNVGTEAQIPSLWEMRIGIRYTF